MPSDPPPHRRRPAARRLARTRERPAPVCTCRACAHGQALPRVPGSPLPAAPLDIADDAIGSGQSASTQAGMAKPYWCCQGGGPTFMLAGIRWILATPEAATRIVPPYCRFDLAEKHGTRANRDFVRYWNLHDGATTSTRSPDQTGPSARSTTRDSRRDADASSRCGARIGWPRGHGPLVGTLTSRRRRVGV